MNGLLIDNFLTSDDLNECVDALLRKEKVVKGITQKVIRHNSSGKPKDKRKRLRKNLD